MTLEQEVQKAARIYVRLYNEKGPDGLEYKFNKSYKLFNMLTKYDIEENRFLKNKKNERFGQFCSLLSRLRIKAKEKKYEKKYRGKRVPNWQRLFYELLQLDCPDLVKKVQDIESDIRLAREAAELFVSLYDKKDNGLEYKFNGSYTLCNLLYKFDVKKNKFLENKKGVRHGQFSALLARLSKKAKEKGYKRKGKGKEIFDWQRVFYKLLQPDYPDLVKQVQYIESDSRLTEEAAELFVSLYDKKDTDGSEYKFSRQYSLDNFLHRFDIKKKMFLVRKNGQFSALLTRLIKKAKEKKYEREGRHGETSDWQKVFYKLLPPNLVKKVQDIESDRRLAREAAELFVSLYGKKKTEGLEYKFSGCYKLSNLFNRYDIKKKIFLIRKNRHGQFYALSSRLRKKAKKENYKKKYRRKETLHWQRTFYELLPPSLVKKVQDIESDRRLAREAAELFVSLYNKKDTNGIEYKFKKGYALHNVLSGFDVRNYRFLDWKRDKGCGQFNNLYARLLKIAKKEKYDGEGRKGKATDWQKLFYELLPLELAKQVQYVESGQRLKDETDERNLGIMSRYMKK